MSLRNYRNENEKMSLYAIALSAISFKITSAENARGETTITSDKLVFDYDDGYALFDGNVIVKDVDLQLTCKKLKVRFEETGKVSWLEADGAVIIQQDDKRATAEKVMHDVTSGEFVLTGSPKVYRGTDMLQGETIRYWRGDNRMVCEPRAKLTVHIDGGSSIDETILKGK